MSEHELKPNGWPQALHELHNVNLRETDITNMVIGVQGESIPKAPDLPEEDIDLQIANMEDNIHRATEILAGTHQHKFEYQLNANHTALRGCWCGLAFVGHMVGSVDNLVWHRVREIEE